MPKMVWVIWEKVKTQSQVYPYHLLFCTALLQYRTALLPSPNKFLLPVRVQSRDNLAVRGRITRQVIPSPHTQETGGRWTTPVAFQEHRDYPQD